MLAAAVVGLVRLETMAAETPVALVGLARLLQFLALLFFTQVAVVEVMTNVRAVALGQEALAVAEQAAVPEPLVQQTQAAEEALVTEQLQHTLEETAALASSSSATQVLSAAQAVR